MYECCIQLHADSCKLSTPVRIKRAPLHFCHLVMIVQIITHCFILFVSSFVCCFLIARRLKYSGKQKHRKSPLQSVSKNGLAMQFIVAADVAAADPPVKGPAIIAIVARPMKTSPSLTKWDPRLWRKPKPQSSLGKTGKFLLILWFDFKIVCFLTLLTPKFKSEQRIIYSSKTQRHVFHIQIPYRSLCNLL